MNLPAKIARKFIPWSLGALIVLIAAAGCRQAVMFPGPGHGTAALQKDLAGAPNAPVSQWPHENSDLAPAPELVFGTLENGFQYVMMKNAKPENRVSMHLSVDAGSFHESKEERGIAHFLEHMLFAGTRHFPPGQLVKYFQRIGMAFGPDVNGSTGFYNTTYDLDLPRADRGALAEGLLVMHDFAAEALLKPEQIDRERSVILAEKRTRDSPEYRTFEATLKFELPDARISRRLPIGVEPVIASADRSLLKTFYDTWYRPERLTLVMVGDFDPKVAEELVRKRFSGLAPRMPSRPVPPFGRVFHQGIKPFYHHEPEAGSTRVAIETLEGSPQPPDSARYQKEQLLSEMADRIVAYRLDQIVNRPDAPFTEADIYSGHFLRFVKSAEISAKCDAGSWDESLSVLERTLRQALEYGFTRQEVARVKKEFTARLDAAVKEAPTRQSGHIANRILHHLRTGRVYQSPRQRKEMLQPVVDAATPARLHRMFKQDWAAGHRLLLVTGNANLSNGRRAPEETIAAVYRQSRQASVPKPAQGKQVHFPYLKAPEGKAEIRDRQVIEDLGVTRVVFENGVTLLVKKTDFEANQVLAAVSFGRGESAEPANNCALAELTEQVINLGGLARLDREALKRALAGKKTEVEFEVEEDRFVFSARSVPDETRLMFQLLYAHLADPGFREKALDLARQKLKQQYASLSHSIQGTMALKGMRFLAGGDCRFGFPGPDAIDKTGLEEIRRWIGPAMREAPLEIAVVGDIDTESVISMAARFFGTLRPRLSETPSIRAQTPDFPEGAGKEFEVATRISKALVVTAYPTADIWDIERTRRLSILSQVLSDRMRIRIREKLGASYAQGAYHRPSRAYKNFGFLAGYAVTDPGDARAVVRAMRDIAGDLNEKGATADELKRALEPTLAEIRKQMKTNDYWLNTVLKGAARHPVQLDWSRSILSDYSGIRLAQINRMARKYLVNAKAARLGIYPETRQASNQPGANQKGRDPGPEKPMESKKRP